MFCHVEGPKVFVVHHRIRWLITTLALFVAMLAIATPPARANLRCAEKRATRTGTHGDDILKGTSDKDVIAGGAGDDVIFGLDGNDLLCGGKGNDKLIGGRGDDWLGGRGGDRLAGDLGSDLLKGGPGGDELFEGPGDDVMQGNKGLDLFYAGAGNDHMAGGQDTDVAVYSLAPRGVRVDLSRHRGVGWGRDTLHSVRTVHGSKFADTLIGKAGTQVLQGNEGDDQLFAKAGLDTLEGGKGDDRIVGGKGNDLVSFSLSSRPVRVDLKRGQASGEGQDKLRNLEAVFGTMKHDRMIGNGESNFFIGGYQDGGDVIRGRGGDDDFYRLYGESDLDGGAGSDMGIYDEVDVGDLNRGTVQGSATSDSIQKIENLWCYCEDETVLVGNDDPNVLIGGFSGDRLSGMSGDDTMSGKGGDDLLDGGPDDDWLRGGTGIDVCTNGERVGTCESGPNSTEPGASEASSLPGGFIRHIRNLDSLASRHPLARVTRSPKRWLRNGTFDLTSRFSRD